MFDTGGVTHRIPDEIVQLPCFALVLVVCRAGSAIGAKMATTDGHVPVTKHTTDFACWRAAAMPSCSEPGKKVMMAACR